MSPQVSVIIATYNRANVLAHALASLKCSTYQDWEAWVIGDGCTDDTATVVESCADARIQFHNLAHNSGDQAEPNNAGFRRAQGRYIAYLNHDDLWFPDHLALALAALEQSQADGVFTLSDFILPNGQRHLIGSFPGGCYQGYGFAPASSWLLRRELLEAVGGWRPRQASYVVPSQEVLQRAWKQGRRLELVPQLTVLAFASKYRPGCYLQHPAQEQAMFLHQLQTAPETLRADELRRLALYYGEREKDLALLRPLSQFGRNLLSHLCLSAGVQPSALSNLLRYGLRRGGFVRALRKQRGLPAEPR